MEPDLAEKLAAHIQPEPIQHIVGENGRARIKRTRSKVIYVASMHVNAGASIEEVMDQYSLTRSEVYAALAYYYDNQELIEQYFADGDAYARQVGTSSDDLIARIKARQQQESP